MGVAPVLHLEPKITQYANNVQLETAVEAEPAPLARWVKDDQPLDSSDRRFVIKTEKLKVANMYRLTLDIENFDKTLAGLYKCFIENDHGKTSATFTVSATGDAPNFPEKPHIIQRDKGKALAIKIKAQSKKEMTVEWTKNDKKVTENDRIKFITKEGDSPGESVFLLEIKGPVKEDQANYKCIVKNEDGSNSQSLELSFD